MDISGLLWMGIPISLLINGVVAFLKKVGVKGEWLTISSLLAGTGFGFLARLELVGAPEVWTGWVAMVAYGLLCGTVASGNYTLVRSMFDKIVVAIEGFFESGVFEIIEEEPEEPVG